MAEGETVRQHHRLNGHESLSILWETKRTEEPGVLHSMESQTDTT